MNRWTHSFLIQILLVFSAMGQTETMEESEKDLLNYSNIKSVLKNDGLVEEKKKKERIVKEIKKEKQKINISRYNYPDADDFWLHISEYWLVKNAQLLRWDFPKPEYGIDSAFKNLLENFGFFNKHYKILIVNSPKVTHLGLPAGKDRYIFVISLPFMRTMDLTKVDISLLLLEDMLRLEKDYLKKNLDQKVDFLGTNFHGKEAPKKEMIMKFLGGYDEIIFSKGFNFQQQFEVTKQMDSYLKSDPALWGAYFNLLKKIDRLIKNDLLYKDYLKIYPSPELQMQWLSPKKKVI
ncbi:MAG: hypothetical protein CME65_02110 [Halobacteriovoraceae bacterium]|nr:hypothetical protein [Halobacteriovoraceae bacterium]|tara:strand:- start:11374 stop:12252 length:879 start_codon:yes stop_codon:yes gene_type:complete